MSQPIDMPEVLLQTPAGGFLVGVGRVGDHLETQVPQEWVAVRWAGLAAVDIRRGHPNKGLSGYGPGTATLTFIDRDGSYNFAGNPLAKPGTPVKIIEPDSIEPLFTGAFSDLTFAYNPTTSQTTMTVNCVDNMATLENHTLYGMRPPSGYPWLAGSETYEARIRRIADRTPVRFAAIPGRPGAIDYDLEDFLTVNQSTISYDIGFTSTSENGFSGYINTTPSTGAGGDWGLTGWAMGVYLPPGRYMLQADLKRGAGSGGIWYAEWKKDNVRSGHSTVSTWTTNPDGTQYGAIQFEFESADHWFEGGNKLYFYAEPGPGTHPATLATLEVENLTIHPANSAGLFLSATVYETSAAQHLTMAADTVGGHWYLSRHGDVCVTWGEPPEDPADYHFTDYEPAGIKYGDLVTTYSTADIVNRLALTNHSIYPEASAIDPGLARDTTHQAVDAASVVRNLPREMSLDLNIFAPTDEELETLVAARAREIFDTRAEIQYLPASLRFRGHDYPDLAAKLDLTQTITIKNDATTHTARVVGIDHVIDPYEWLVTLELEPVRTL